MKTKSERRAVLLEEFVNQGLTGEALVRRFRSRSQRQSVAIEYQSEGHDGDGA